MRAKDAVDVERKAQSRHVEKQAKAIERLVDSERNLLAQVVRTSFYGGDTNPIDYFYQGDLEKEVVQWKKRAESGEATVEILERENVELKHAKAMVGYFTEKVGLQNVPFSAWLVYSRPVRLVQNSLSGAPEANGKETSGFQDMRRRSAALQAGCPSQCCQVAKSIRFHDGLPQRDRVGARSK
jgi:hypothetical protein